MNLRFSVIKRLERSNKILENDPQPLKFSSHVFPKELTQTLPPDLILEAIKSWAAEKGAAQYAFWTFPLKRKDLFFICPKPLQELSEKKLFELKSEAVSGELLWDAETLPFLLKSEKGVLLCLPAVFFSSNAEALDLKIYLRKSFEKLKGLVSSVFSLFTNEKKTPSIQLEGELGFFLVDEGLYFLRQDLVLTQRTLFGSHFSKKQDKHLKILKSRIDAFKLALEKEAFASGILIRQSGGGSSYVSCHISGLSLDSFFLLKTLIEKNAQKQGFRLLFQEGLSLEEKKAPSCVFLKVVDEAGQNLLSPKENTFFFTAFLCAFLRAIDHHKELILAGMFSFFNHKPIASQFFLEKLYEGGFFEKNSGEAFSFMRELTLEEEEEGEIAFSKTGIVLPMRQEKELFALPILIFAAALSDHLSLILDEIRDVTCGAKCSEKELFHLAFPIFKKHFASLKKKPSLGKNLDPLFSFKSPKTTRAFQDILNEKQLEICHEILIEKHAAFFSKVLDAALFICEEQVFPVIEEMKRRGRIFKKIQGLYEKAFSLKEEIKELGGNLNDMGWEAKLRAYEDLFLPKIKKLREMIDALEEEVDDSLWPLPKYKELFYTEI